MNEAEGAILRVVDTKLEGIHNHGCGFGKVIGQRIKTVEEGIGSIESKMDAFGNKLSLGIIFVVIISFLAGINVWDGVLRAIVR